MSPATRTPTGTSPGRSTGTTARTVEVGSGREPRLRAPRRSLSGVVAALQAVTLSFAVVVLPAVTAFLAAPAGPGQGTGWGRSMSVGAGLWLLGHGVPQETAAVTITLVPLGLTALALFACFAAARRSSQVAFAAWVAGTVTYAGVTTGVAALVDAAEGWALLVALLGGAVVAGVGLGAGILARPDAPRLGELTARLDPWISPAARLGVRGAFLAVCLAVVAAAVLTAGWLVAGRATSGDIVVGLAPGPIGGVVLAVAQLVVLPVLVVWALAWLVGPGFVVGEGSTFTTAGAESGPLPAVPLLGALPGDDWSNAVSTWSPALLVAIGVVAGVFVGRRLGAAPRWTDLVLAALTVALTVALVVGALVALASGAVGPGRLATVGAPALLTAGLAAAELGGGAALALLWARLVPSRRTRDD